MDERRMTRMLERLLDGQHPDAREDVEAVEDFVQAGVMTLDRGVVVRMNNGAEFHVTVQKVRRGFGEKAEG